MLSDTPAVESPPSTPTTKAPALKLERAPHRVLGLFAGVGGFELGLSRAGHEPGLLCEIWDPAVAVLGHRFPNVPLVRDVCDLASDVDAVPAGTSLLTAGFPCTDLSQAGMMAGIGGEHSGLVYQVFRLLHGRAQAGNPIPWLIIENVPNMLHLKRGEAMDVIVTELERLGYMWAYRVVDSRAFGVPQRRRRVFLVASTEGDPRHVVLSDDAGAPEEPRKDDWTPGSTTVGFYWTEGLKGVGWAHEAVPTLKGGSTVGVPSSPGVMLPDGRVVMPHIRDAERMQGFEAGWTEPAEQVAKRGYRWKLVGNAVTVDVAEWLGNKLRRPVTYDGSVDVPMPAGTRWPTAAWNVEGTRMISTVSEYPKYRPRAPLAEFLEHEPDPLSLKATRGFLSRATSDRCNLRFPDGFLDVLRSHLESMIAAK